MTRREVELEVAKCLHRMANELAADDSKTHPAISPKEFIRVMFGVLGGIQVDLVHIIDEWDKK